VIDSLNYAVNGQKWAACLWASWTACWRQNWNDLHLGSRLPDTPIPISTPIPSETPIPPPPTNTLVAPTEEPAQSLEEIQADFRDAVIRYMESIYEVGSVTLVRLQPGELVIELRTQYSARSNQPDVSFIVTRGLADAFIEGELTREKAATITGGSDFQLNLTTYSDDGDYRYHSISTWELLELLAQRAVSYGEWAAGSNAGFE